MDEIRNIVKKIFTDHIAVAQKSLDILLPEIEAGGQLLLRALENRNTIFICGNGGSAADSQHIAAELVWRFKKDRIALPAVALTTDTSILTSIANDIGYEEVFSRQIEALGSEGDVLIAISTSGTSKNVVKAINKAKRKNMKVIVLTGDIKVEEVDVCISVPSGETARIQEVHQVIYHAWCEYLDTQPFS